MSLPIICGKPRTQLYSGVYWTILPIEFLKPQLPVQIEFRGVTWTRQQEFHITLASGRYLAKLLDVSEANSGTMLKPALERVFSDSEILVVSVGPEIRFLRGRSKETIVVMCQVSGLEPVYDRLREEIGIRPDLPPTHVTLFSTATDRSGVAMSTSSKAHRIPTQLTRSEEKDLKELLNYSDVFGAI